VRHFNHGVKIMEIKDVKRKPSPEYRFWLYDPEGDGMVYFKTAESRDNAGARAIEQYLDDMWAEEVEYVSAGELTHFAQVLHKNMRPDDLDEEECDGEGTYWSDGMEWRGNYTLAPLTHNV
jgi:hypothetical protein